MARNSEKAQSMLFRFREQQAADLGIIDAGRTRRPKVITEINSIPSCEKWRGQVVKDISRKVTKIQDRTSLSVNEKGCRMSHGGEVLIAKFWKHCTASLSNYQIRDLNDEINKLMREKHMWEVQLRNLGGPNYMRFAAKMTDEEGREIPGHRGYKYFGRARELPGVKELFDELRIKPEDEKEKTTINDIRKNVDANYYGFNRDEEDEKLLEYEATKEEESRKTLGASSEGDPTANWEPIDAGWKVPTREEVTAFLLERRKSKLLEKLE